MGDRSFSEFFKKLVLRILFSVKKFWAELFYTKKRIVMNLQNNSNKQNKNLQYV